MYESFRSHCAQNYPEYEMLFGINDESDPAAVLVLKLQQEFPDRAIHLLICKEVLGANAKVSSLAQLAAAAKYESLVVSDGDIRVAPDYLRTVISELQPEGVGLVTCLYRGVPAPTLGSRLESLGISTDFAPGVLAAQTIEGGLHFGLGSTLALRRRELDATGGFASVADYLADDYELGRRIAERGRTVVLSRSVVDTFLPSYTFSGFFSHQLRWARTIRASRPAGYAGLLLTFTVPWAIACVLLARGATWAWTEFGITVFLRMLMALVMGSVALHDREVRRSLWLLPLRDILAPVLWLGGIFGRRIVWRGEEFQLSKRKLKRIS
jgi:ceramide glucosyltransferase